MYKCKDCKGCIDLQTSLAEDLPLANSFVNLYNLYNRIIVAIITFLHTSARLVCKSLHCLYVLHVARASAKLVCKFDMLYLLNGGLPGGRFNATAS